MDAVLDAPARVVGIGGAVGEERGGERAGGGRLAAPRGTVEQIGVRRRAVRRKGRAEDGQGMGMALEGGQHGRDEGL